MALRRLSDEEYLNGILAGNRAVLSKAITLVESTLASDKMKAQQLISQLLPYAGNSFRLGISGVPGVGKSTFIEELGALIIRSGRKLAVLTIDPSSNRSSGSILGDKTRMTNLTVLPEVFIRPSPSSSLLGGVGRCTAESILLCEAAGYDFIIIETVGVGQSEIQVKNIVDFFLVMLLPGGGDDLQGIKKGIIEEADLIVINKAEGANMDLALESKYHYESVVHLNGDSKKVMLSSTRSKLGLKEVWEEVLLQEQLLNSTGQKKHQRQQQKLSRLKTELPYRLEQQFFATDEMKNKWRLMEVRILANEITVEQGLDELLGGE